MKKLYIDIDGVLVTHKNTQMASGSIGLINFIIEHFDCYWLTTHCKGDTSPALSYLNMYFTPEIIEKLKNINPTRWNTWKTEAIDFNSDFLWLDDSPMQFEIETLKKYRCQNNLILVNLKKPNELYKLQNKLKKIFL